MIEQELHGGNSIIISFRMAFTMHAGNTGPRDETSMSKFDVQVASIKVLKVTYSSKHDDLAANILLATLSSLFIQMVRLFCSVEIYQRLGLEGPLSASQGIMPIHTW